MPREPRYDGVRALVLGATGFIGQWTARALANAGAHLHLAIRPGGTDRLRSLGLAGHPEEVDLDFPGSARALVERVQPAIVFNLAGYGVDPAERDPARAERLNEGVVGELAEAAAGLPSDWQGLRLVHTGSALEYGRARGDLEEDTTPEPTTLYGQTKLAGTRAVAAASAAGLRAVTARLFTVYGPGEAGQRLLPSLRRAARERRPLALTSGHQRRDFTYVEEVAEGLLRLGHLAAAPGHTINLATGRLESVRGFAVRAAAVLGMDPGLLRFGALPDRPEEMAHDPVQTGRLEAACGWRPGMSIEEGVRRTVAAAP